MRFAKNQMEAEDILQEGFIRVFVNLKTYRGEGSLEGWIRRTIVNTAINLYKKNLKHLKDTDIEAAGGFSGEEENALDKLSLMELLQIIQDLPDPTHLMDVSETFEVKLEAWSHFKTAEEHLDSMDVQLEARARHHGAKIGVKYAEALKQYFFLPTEIRDPATEL